MYGRPDAQRFDVAELAVAVEHFAFDRRRTADVKDADEIGSDRVDARGADRPTLAIFSRSPIEAHLTRRATTSMSSSSRSIRTRTTSVSARNRASARTRSLSKDDRLRALSSTLSRSTRTTPASSAASQRVAQRCESLVDLGKRHQHEGALAQARVRNAASRARRSRDRRRAADRDRSIAVPSARPAAAHSRFDRLQRVEQRVRRQFGLEQRDRVEKPRLIDACPMARCDRATSASTTFPISPSAATARSTLSRRSPRFAPMPTYARCALTSLRIADSHVRASPPASRLSRIVRLRDGYFSARDARGRRRPRRADPPARRSSSAYDVVDDDANERACAAPRSRSSARGRRSLGRIANRSRR